MPACEEDKSGLSTLLHNKNEASTAISEPGTSEVVVPKSAIDVALELIAQAENEALEAARIAALNKPKPRGRPPLHRRSVEADGTAASSAVNEPKRSIIPQKNCGDHQDALIGEDQQSVLPKRGAPPITTSVPDTILKDHLEVEAVARNAQPNLEVSLFGEEGNFTEPEPADFDKMVLLNYGSADGRLEDDEEPASAPENINQGGVLPARKELKFRENRKADEEAAVVQRILEEVCPSTSFRAGSSSSGTANKEYDEELTATTNPRKRGPYKKKARGRPKKNEKDQQEYFPPSQKTGRPRGRPRKDGADPIPRSEKKSVEKKYNFFNGRNGTRPRRAASMIQDFLELYAKVDLADLEEVHARATTFVRMLIDEYAAASKDDSKKLPRKEERRSSSYEGVANDDASKTKREVKTDPYDFDEGMDTSSLKQEEMEVSNVNSIGDDESGEEAESSGEYMAEDYESNSDANEDLINNGRVIQRHLSRTVLPDDFIDAIPVIRGTALQPLPTMADSALR